MATDTPQTIITLINNSITDNGNNEISAAVLRPVLLAIINYIDQTFGNPDDLSTTAKIFVDSINELIGDANSVFSLRTGTDDPNVTPPSEFNLGDFYSRTSGGNPISYWNFDGSNWIELVGKKSAQGNSSIRTVAISATVQDVDDTIIYNGADGNDVITIPTAANSIERKLIMINQHSEDISTSISFIDFLGLSTLAVTANGKTIIQSDGTNWYKI